MSNTMLRLPQVTEKIGLSRSTIYKMMDAGEFPKPIKLTRKAVAWPESAITEWLASRPVAA
ncbi:helix-turn-helix transcriptional regulator [Paracoccus yeei]|uniref:DNA-binding protein n=1 Tax=Paracoccus yeei TaxID=147645 RepID=A0A2D2BYV4_9RHOB|nr:AlpA family transcriptional regulator [Paracoccus yeei]ATQ55339.1 DNA-binding protein [Paracoccus yeei]